MAKNVKNNRKKSGKRRFYKRKTFWLVCVMLIALVGVVSYIVADQYTEEYRERAKTYDLSLISKVEVPSIILDRQGKEIGRIFVQNRSIMDVEDVPELFINALLAGEDSRFFGHDGIDYIGVVRAIKLNFEAGSTTQGASTITQQLARNAYPLRQDALAKGESGIQRKMVEAFLAQRIEKSYSKMEILGFYLNRIYFGSGFYGLKSASLGYFGKEPKDLNLSECASIVGLIKNPTNNSPLNDLAKNRKVRDMVLTRMVDEKMIKGSEAAKVRAKPVVVNSKPLQRGTSHLYERIADQVTKVLGSDALSSGGFTIHTSISADMQFAAEDALKVSLEKAENHPGFKGQKYRDYKKGGNSGMSNYLQGAVFAVDHETGEVLAHVGGRDYSDAQFDFIEMGERPLGTAFFPFIYATALADKHTPASTLGDEPMDNRAVMVGGREGILGEWGAEVASPKYEGQVTLRRAFVDSKIAATVRLVTEVGLQRVIDASAIFGFSMKDSEPLPRVSVGWEPVSMKEAVGAYATFPLEGKKGDTEYTYIDRIEDPEGDMIFRKPRPSRPSRKRLLHEAVAYQVHSMLRDGMEHGSARGLMGQMAGKPFYGAGKGGTTHDFADTWFLGYNARITCGVWTGFLQGNSERIYTGAFSRDIAMPVWTATMNAAAPVFGGKEIKKPDSLMPVEICTVSGERATEFCQEVREDLQTGTVKSVSTSVTEYFREGKDNLPFCSLHSGALSGGLIPGGGIESLPALDALPVRPTKPVLLGEDPFHTEMPSYVDSGENSGRFRRSSNVLDSLDLQEFDETIRIKRPGKLFVYPD
ncbi:MAG: transglycosylase domain-containing protein [Luteolibacter sp.]